MKFFKKLRLKSKKQQKLPTVFLNKGGKNSLRTKKSLKQISKRNFKKNAPINLLGKFKQISKWLWLSLFFALLIGGTYFVFYTDTFNIKTLLIFEGEAESTNLQLIRTIEPLRNRNILLFSQEKLIETIKNRIDNVTNVEINLQLPNTVVIHYETYQDISNITNLIGPAKVRKSFIINENGVLTEENKISALLPNITIHTEKAYLIGQKITDSDTLKYIEDSRNYFEEKFDLEIYDTRYIPKAKELRFTTAHDTEIWLDLLLPYKEQFQKLKNAIPKINIYDNSLQYIDLRIQASEGQKIIYK